jgi:hypothetical protein
MTEKLRNKDNWLTSVQEEVQEEGRRGGIESKKLNHRFSIIQSAAQWHCWLGYLAEQNKY